MAMRQASTNLSSNTCMRRVIATSKSSAAGSRCRNNVGDWLTRQVATNSSRRDFDFYATKDIHMAQQASFGFMIWDGESAGTLMNVWRLIKQNKKVVILEASETRLL